MKKLFAASCLLLATVHATNVMKPAMKKLVQAEASCDCGGCGARCNELTLTDFTCPRDDCDRVCYERECSYLRDYDALRNPVILTGPKVVTVNLDDRIQTERLEKEGVFLDLGDILVVFGRENNGAL